MWLPLLHLSQVCWLSAINCTLWLTFSDQLWEMFARPAPWSLLQSVVHSRWAYDRWSAAVMTAHLERECYEIMVPVDSRSASHTFMVSIGMDPFEFVCAYAYKRYQDSARKSKLAVNEWSKLRSSRARSRGLDYSLWSHHRWLVMTRRLQARHELWTCVTGRRQSKLH